MITRTGNRRTFMLGGGLLLVCVLMVGVVLPSIVSARTLVQELRCLTPGLDGIGGDGWSGKPQINSKGQVVFESDATDLVAGITSGSWNIYLYDNGTLSCLTPGTGGNGANNESFNAQINEAGQVVFCSRATNLLAGITSGESNIYLYDNGVLSCLTPGTGGSGANSESYNPQINEAGQVVFYSYATDLLAGITSGNGNIYLSDNGTLSCLTPGTGGSGANNNSYDPQINEAGQVVFSSDATDLVAGITSWGNIYLYDNGTLSCLTPGTGGSGANSDSYNPQINEAGQVVFNSYATNILAGITSGSSSIYLYDNGVLSCLTPGTGGNGANANSYGSQINEAGQVVFYSYATDLLAGITNELYNIYLYDNGVLSCLTPGTGGSGANGNSYDPQINEAGQVVFSSDATDLLAGITSGDGNIYLYDNGTLSCLTPGTGGSGANGYSSYPQINEAGQVVFYSYANNLVAGITSGGPDQESICQVYLSDQFAYVDVTFDAQNNTKPDLVVTVAEGTAVSEPTVPTKAGFTFAGWWTDPTGGTLWDFSTPVTADMTLYAHWTPNEAPPTPDPTIPDTGDSIALFMPLIVALAGVAAAGTALNRKREQ